MTSANCNSTIRSVDVRPTTTSNRYELTCENRLMLFQRMSSDIVRCKFLGAFAIPLDNFAVLQSGAFVLPGSVTERQFATKLKNLSRDSSANGISP